MGQNFCISELEQRKEKHCMVWSHCQKSSLASHLSAGLQVGVPGLQASMPVSGPSECLSLLTCPTSSDVTGLYPSGQGRSQQTRADVAAVLWGWLEVRCLWLMHPL